MLRIEGAGFARELSNRCRPACSAATQLEVEVPSEFQGSVVGNLSGKPANLSSSHELEGTCRIEAQVPLVEMLDYTNEIRSLTQGKGAFTMTPSGYESMPQRVAELVLKPDAHRKVNIG